MTGYQNITIQRGKTVRFQISDYIYFSEIRKAQSVKSGKCEGADVNTGTWGDAQLVKCSTQAWGLSLSPAHPRKGWHAWYLSAEKWRQEALRSSAGQLASLIVWLQAQQETLTQKRKQRMTEEANLCWHLAYRNITYTTCMHRQLERWFSCDKVWVPTHYT